jgi:hypothetical protein
VALTFLAVQGAVGLFIYPAFNPLKTPAAFAREVQERLPPDRPLLIYRVNGEILALYSNRRGVVLRSPEELLAALAQQERGIVVFEKRDFDAWPADAPALPGTSHEFRMGRKHFIWLEFGSETL